MDNKDLFLSLYDKGVSAYANDGTLKDILGALRFVRGLFYRSYA